MLRSCLLLLSLCQIAPAAEPPWKAAAAKAKITPTEMMWMAGYASRTKPANGVTLDLYAKVLLLEDDGGRRLAIVTLDLIGVPRNLRESLEKQVQERFQLPPERLLLNASHTHSGPELRESKWDQPEAQADRIAQAHNYSRQLEQTILNLLADCQQRLEPHAVSYTHARCGFAMNRRLPTESGYQNSPYPEGPVDHDVPVIRVDGIDGKPRAILFGYACHNTTLALQQFNGDYAGYAQEALEAANPGCIALFVLGCGGDQNPYPRSKVELAQQHGRSLATAVEAALLPKPKPLTGPLVAALDIAPLAFAPAPTKSELEARLTSKSGYEVAHARRLLQRLDQEGDLPREYPYLVQVVRFGEGLTIVALAGEVVVDYSLRLKRELPNETVWVAGYSNDVFGYVPSQRVLKEGGYEAGGAMLYTSFPGPFAEDVEDRIHSTIGKLLTGTREQLTSSK